jgi:glycosyltransferase involved in cell wall biosynthesis
MPGELLNAGHERRPEAIDPLPRTRIAVVPASARELRPRLFAALESAFAVSFSDDPMTAADDRLPDAVIGFGVAGAAAVTLMPGVPALLALNAESELPQAPQPACFGNDRAVPAALRGGRLSEAHAAIQEQLSVAADDHVIATLGARVAWKASADGTLNTVCAMPCELEPGEALRQRLRPGRFLSLAALVHFLRDVLAPGWSAAAPLHAAFLIDDPNLHWPSYGHVHFEALRRHAQTHGYHVSIAMAPADGRFVHPRAADIFRYGSRQLSLCIHGNDHDGPEFGRPRDIRAGLKPAAQALQRTLAFERRTGLRVDRVMVPPHERLSEPAARAVARLGYAAACVTRPYPWLSDSAQTPWLTAPPEAGPLTGLRPGEIMPGGLPAMLRIGFDASDEELALRAFLGQPLILYGHHDLLAGGLDLLAQRAESINRLGAVQWGSLADVATGAYQTRGDDDVLEVRMLGREIHFRVPPGIRRLRIDARELASSEADRVVLRTPNGIELGELRAASPASIHADFGGPIEARLERPPIAALPSTRTRPRAVGRRVIAESHDRASALSPRLRRDPLQHPAREPDSTAPRVLIIVENGSVPSDRRVWLESTTLTEAGMEVHVICPIGERADERSQCELRDGVHIHRYRPQFAENCRGGYVQEYGWAMFATWRMVRRLTREQPFDIVHACNPPDLLLLAARPARRRGASQIFDHHDLVPELLGSRFGEGHRLLGRLTRAAERVAFRAADVVISTNESYAEIARTRGHKPDADVFVVRNGPDLDRFKRTAPAPELKAGAANLIAYVGVMAPQDGVDQALRALALVNRRRQDWHAVFGGTGSARAQLIELAHELGLDQMVEFPGWLDDAGLTRLLSTADICLAPEPKTAFNDASTMVKLAEYLAMSTPVVSFDLIESRRVAADAALYASDTVGYAARIEQLLDDPALRTRMGTIGRARVEDSLSWGHSRERLLEAYRAALVNARARRER